MEQSAWKWLAAALAAGCAHSGPEAGLSGTVVPADLQRDLARLEALGVIEVAGVDPSAVETSGHCYGLCPEELEELAEVQGPRLRALVEVAEQVVKETPSCEGVDADKQLAALSELRIVTGASLVQEEAQPESNCYNLPCPDEVERVEQRNCERLGELAAIVAGSRDL